jgi:hypothetical protein
VQCLLCFALHGGVFSAHVGMHWGSGVCTRRGCIALHAHAVLSSSVSRLRVSGVPTFLIGAPGRKAYMFSGAQPVEVFREVFEKVLAEAA